MSKAHRIIEIAFDHGIREFDTAQAYENSEKVLGSIFAAQGIVDKVRIITKPILNSDSLSRSPVQESLNRSLENLGISKLYCFMLHREELLDQWNNDLGEIITELIDNGLIEHIGVSVYSPQRALQALDIEGISVIQIPSNALDRRFENTGIFSASISRGKQIYVRSIFLQGLLLLEPKELSPGMAFAEATLNAFKRFAEKTNISPHNLALSYVREAYPEAKIIFGVETPAQASHNLRTWQMPPNDEIVDQIQTCFRSVDPKILNPGLWRKGN